MPDLTPDGSRERSVVTSLSIVVGCDRRLQWISDDARSPEIEIGHPLWMLLQVVTRAERLILDGRIGTSCASRFVHDVDFITCQPRWPYRVILTRCHSDWLADVETVAV